MVFLFPAVLGALAAIGIPIAIHLLNKLRVRVVDWGAMRFLLDSLRKNERRVKLEDLLLLILRCLLVALLVFAFARPALKALAAGNVDATGPVSAIVILDNSASMTQSNAVESRFDQAKKEIAKWIDARQGGQSLVAFFLASTRTQAVIPRPQADLALFRKMLEVARPTDRGADLASAIRLAYQTLVETGGRDREIRVYSDDQSSGWAGLEEVRKLVDENPDIALRTIRVGAAGEDNLGITGLRSDGGVPSAGQPCRMRIEVGNYGTQAASGVALTVAIDGEPAGEAIIASIAPGTTQAADVVVNFPNAGPHAVTARIPPDALAIDNERAAGIDVVRRMNVLIVEGGPPAESVFDRDGFFLANALAPLPPERASQYYLAAAFTTVEQLDAAALEDAAAVFFANPGSISADVAARLRDYVAAGRSIVVFPGPQTDPNQWKQNSTWSDLLPATLGPVWTSDSGSAAASWQSRDFEHPVTALWNDAAQGSLGSVKVTQYFPLQVKEPAAATSGRTATGRRPSVIARLDSGDPAVVEWQFGKGHVVLFHSSATPDWTNLPLHPSFVALVQRLMGYLTRGDQARYVLAPGESFVMDAPAEWRGKDFSVLPPGPDATKRVAGQVSFDEGRSAIRFSNTEAVGAYRVFVDENPVAAFAVQLDPRESDLRQVDTARLEELVKPPKPGEVKVAPRRLVVTREFWTPLIWIALAIAIAEAALAHRFSRAR